MTRHSVHFGPVLGSVGVDATLSASEAEAAKHDPATDDKPQSFASADSNILTPDSQDSFLIKMADAMSAVSVGSLSRIAGGEDVVAPVFQCLQIKPMASQNGQERYRVVMNDTTNFMQGMIGQRE